jgi:hypothetical protein
MRFRKRILISAKPVIHSVYFFCFLFVEGKAISLRPISAPRFCLALYRRPDRLTSIGTSQNVC